MPRVGDLTTIQSSLPSLHVLMVPFNLKTFEIILPYAIILAAIGLIESLLTLNLVGDIVGRRGGAPPNALRRGWLMR